MCNCKLSENASRIPASAGLVLYVFLAGVAQLIPIASVTAERISFYQSASKDTPAVVHGAVSRHLSGLIAVERALSDKLIKTHDIIIDIFANLSDKPRQLKS